MRISVFFLFFTVAQIWATGTYSQTTRLSLNVKNARVLDVLNEIEEKSEFYFLFNQKYVDIERKVDVEVRQRKIEDILSEMFAGTNVNYLIMDKQIVLTTALPGSQELQQPIQLTGKVTDSAGQPLPGVSVVVKGTAVGTVTNAEGIYSITNIPNNATLQFSFVGMKGLEVFVGNQTTINATLEEDFIGIEEIVAIGYGTQKKKDFTGAISHVKGQKMEKESPTSVQDMLIGNIPGLNVSFNASPKGGGSLLIRGKSSLTAGTSPLLVVDGVIYYGDLADINPFDIANVDVLKDASSAAVFGAKAANGVILITTKKGISSKPTISFKADFGIATMEVNQRPNDPEEFLTWRQNVQENIFVNYKPYQFADPRKLPSDITVASWLAYTGSSDDPVKEWLHRLNFQEEQVKNYLAGNTINWYDEVFRNGLRQDYTISLSGKKEEVSYFMSLEYLNNEGIVVGDKFSTIRGRLNLEGKATEFLTAGINLQFADMDESQVPVNWPRMATNSPYGSKYNEDGSLRWSPDSDAGGLITAEARNPFLEPEYIDRLNKTKTLFSNIYLKGALPLGFSYQVSFTPNIYINRYFNANSSLNNDYTTIGGTAYRNHRENYNWQVDNIIKWEKTIKEIHRIDVTLLANAEKYQSWYSHIYNEGFQPNDNLSYHNIGSGTNVDVSSTDEYSTGDALMARLNYSLKSKYLLTMSIRRDGYSAFGQKNPRATFPAVALGWVLGEEEFLKSKEWLNDAKLRFSYGINGNRDIGRYQALSNLSTGKYLYATTSGTAYQVSELFVNRMSNPNLSWEKTTAYNVGFDMTVLNGKLDGSIDLYKKSTTDLLVLRSLPNITGFKNVMDNLGEVMNKGIELNLNSRNLDLSNFSWNSTLNFSLNRNKIVHLYGPVNVLDNDGNVIGQTEPDDADNGWFIGHDIDAIWDLKVLGVWQVDEEAEAKKYGVRPGDFKLEDTNGDYLYTDIDRQFLGFRSPRFQWTLRNEFVIYKNFDFSFMIYSNWGQMRTFNQAKNATGFPDKTNNYKFPYWTPENQINDFAANNSSSGGAIYSVYRKSSFIRLRNIVVGYNFPKSLANKMYLENLKAYFNIYNVGFYAPDWNFWDPENSGPTPRNFSLGINLTL